jgi:flavin reductase (DIM6/NTAB) family NADH-FMN oxidoreductase RutF/NAD(P)H-dependent FMN reductase
MKASEDLSITPDAFKNAFSKLAAGVTVIAFDRDGRKHGFTATSLTPVSVDPPMALFCVGNGNDSHAHLKVQTAVGISILSKAQAELSGRFAGKTGAERYAGVATIERTPGIPLLSGAVAVMEGTITSTVPAGDHTIYLCQLNWAHADPDGVPLLYYARHYHKLAPLSPSASEEPCARTHRQAATAHNLVAVVASAAPSTRTAAAVHYVCRRARDLSPGLSADIVNLHELPLPLCDGRRPGDVASVSRVVARVEAATSVLLATPIYRGTFTAALKNLLDWLPLESLQAKRVGLIASGATSHHYLVIDQALRPLLAWFNASPIPGSVYLTKDDITADGCPSEATAANLDALARALIVEPASIAIAGPPPLQQQLSCWQLDEVRYRPPRPT